MGGDGSDQPELTGARGAPRPPFAGASRRVVAAWAVAAALIGGASVGGCSLILGFDKSSLNNPNIDAAMIAGADAAGDQICAALEPDDSLQQPAVLLPGTYEGALCPAATDKDYIAFDVETNQDVTVDLSFDDRGGANDIDLRLYNAATGQIVATAATSGPSEHLARTAAGANQLPAGRYVVELFQGATATASPAELPYSITISVTAPPPPADAAPPPPADAAPPIDAALANPRKDALLPARIRV